MLKVPPRIILVILLVAGLTLTSLQPVNAALFPDLEGHWAHEPVCRASVVDLIKGYPDGNFRPEQSLSEMEALVLFMRAAGYNLDKSKSSRVKSLPVTKVTTPQVSWGQNYLDQAAADNLIDKSWLADFNGDHPITRARTAGLLCRLLKLPESDTAGVTLFTDLNKAAPEYRTSIVAVARAGIINGFADGSFRPGEGLKRGEAAALLDNMIKDNWLQSVSDRQVEGWIPRIDFKPNPPEIELQTLQGSKKYKLSPEVKCFKNGKECPYQQILHWRVIIHLDSKKQAVCITLLEKRAAAKENKIRGTIRAVALGQDSFLTMVDLNGKEQILPLSWGAELDSGGKNKTKGFQALKPGTFIDAYLSGDEVMRVAVLTTKSLSGNVNSVTGKRLELENKGSKGNQPTWFNYWDRARIINKDGRNDYVIRGDKVKITYLDPDPEGIDDEIPLEIIITGRPQWKKVTGEVERIGGSGEGRQVVLKKNKNYTLDTTATVYREDGSIIALSDINPGDKVEAMVDGAGIVMKLILKDPPA
ncbi:MAG: S-layer homology domain-containing protein [Syntrophomonadaceae bacterium]|nr:S-layer homology domain-containing protein [Syntrophomonadaceae bacterium]